VQLPEFDFAPLAVDLTNEILPNSTRANIQHLPETIRNATHLSIYRGILSQPVLNGDLARVRADLSDLDMVYDVLVCNFND
jgi:hypothetical protein